MLLAIFQFFDHRDHAIHLLLRCDRVCAGAGGFAADIENIGAFCYQLVGLMHGVFGVAE